MRYIGWLKENIYSTNDKAQLRCCATAGVLGVCPPRTHGYLPSSWLALTSCCGFTTFSLAAGRRIGLSQTLLSKADSRAYSRVRNVITAVLSAPTPPFDDPTHCCLSAFSRSLSYFSIFSQPDWICLLLQRDRDARRAWQLLKAVQTSGWGGSSSKPKPAKGQLQNPEKVRRVLSAAVQAPGSSLLLCLCKEIDSHVDTCECHACKDGYFHVFTGAIFATNRCDIISNPVGFWFCGISQSQFNNLFALNLEKVYLLPRERMHPISLESPQFHRRCTCLSPTCFQSLTPSLFRRFSPSGSIRRLGGPCGEPAGTPAGACRTGVKQRAHTLLRSRRSRRLGGEGVVRGGGGGG